MQGAHSIQHLIVLMLENQSFDRLLGFLPDLGDLREGMSIPEDPQKPGTRVPVSRPAQYAPALEPPHDLNCVNLQLFGSPHAPADPRAQAPMNGFVRAALAECQDAARARTVMECFDPPTQLPVLATLARHYRLCRRWHASVPGPTWPNRYFAHAATSAGIAHNFVPLPFGTRTIFESLSNASPPIRWTIYFEDIPTSLSLLSLWKYPGHFKPFANFLADAAAGRLPGYAFIEPRYFSVFGAHANDCHPPHDIRYGEQLIAQVYNAVSQGPAWQSSLLLILFDEHGGYYETVAPPPAPNPDGRTSAVPSFGFDRLGLRVPAILISPYINPGPDDTVYEHASIPATIKKLFGLRDFLNARDAAANTFEGVVELDAPRTDARSIVAPLPPSSVRAAGAASGASVEQRGLLALGRLLASDVRPASVGQASLLRDLSPLGPCASVGEAAVPAPASPAEAEPPGTSAPPEEAATGELLESPGVPPTEEDAGKQVRDWVGAFLTS